MSAPLRSVLLSIEDHSFAALAAMSTSVMLEDESYPELPEFHNSLSLTSTSAVTSPNEPPRPSLPQQETQEKKSKSGPQALASLFLSDVVVLNFLTNRILSKRCFRETFSIRSQKQSIWKVIITVFFVHNRMEYKMTIPIHLFKTK